MQPGDDTNTARSGERREWLKGMAALTVAGIASEGIAQAQQALVAVRAASFAEVRQPKPLPFDSSALRGLSKRLIDSHWSNNYSGAVRALNETKKRLAAALGDKDLPAYLYNDLKREHLLRTGSVVLHELYFDNLGGDGQAGREAQGWLAAAFGGFDRWETEFRRIAAGLGGGSGWVVLGYNHTFGTAENYWMADHAHCPVATTPLLVMDMYEHSYQIDFGAAVAQYVDAFFANIKWESVAARIAALSA